MSRLHPVRFVLVVVVAAILGVAPGSVRETSAQVTTEAGLTLGLNLATLHPDAGPDLDLRTAFTGGVVLTVTPTGLPIALQPELLFMQKGMSIEGEDAEVRYGAAYVELPVLLRVDAPSIGPVTPHVLGGGFGGIKVFERQSVGGLGANLPLRRDGTYFERVDAGLVVGLGATLGVGPGRLGLTARYSHGLVDVAQDVTDPVFDSTPFPADAQTRTFTFLVRFGL